MGSDTDLLWRLSLHLVLTGLPMVAALIVAARRGMRHVAALLGTGLAVSGITAMLVFWVFWLDPTWGRATAFGLVGACVIAIALARPHQLDRSVLVRLAVPVALWAFASMFVLYLGFVHGGTDQPLPLATARFSHQLPTDNEIPVYFSGWYYVHGHSSVPPPYGDWLSSDRPPLQVGYTLAQRPFGWDSTNLHYQVLAVVVQQLWVVGMWAVLVAARVGRAARGLTMVAALVSDIVIVHGFFVWPKLIAATFVLAALALVLSDDWIRWRRSPAAWTLFASLCALSMLAHGASAFALIVLVPYALLRGRPSWRPLVAAVLAALALMGPWTAYQRWFDPPGDRLVKWQLGGSLAIDGRGSMETIEDSYRAAGWHGTYVNKRNNLTGLVHPRTTEQVVRAAADQLAAGKWHDAVANLRYVRFFWIFPSLGLLALGAVVMALARVRRRIEGPQWRFALTSLGFCAAVAADWVLLMFGSAESSTLIHQGTLFLPLLAIAALVVGTHAVAPRLAAALTLAHALFVLALYVPVLAPPSGTSYSVVAFLLAGSGLIGFAWASLRPDATDRSPARRDQRLIAADG